jgi:hypothetical protein
VLCYICIYMLPTLNKNYLTLLYYFSAISGQAEFMACFNRIGVAQFSVFSALSTIVCFFVLFCPFLSGVLSVVLRFMASDCFEFISKFGLKCDGNYSEKSTYFWRKRNITISELSEFCVGYHTSAGVHIGLKQKILC